MASQKISQYTTGVDDSYYVVLAEANTANYKSTVSAFRTHILGSFTQGSVVFAGASGLSQNNSKLFFDNTNYRLGLNINSSLLGKVHIVNSAADEFGVLIKAHASQTENLFEIQDSSGNTHASINSAGNFTNSPTSGSELFGATTGSAITTGVNNILFGNSAGTSIVDKTNNCIFGNSDATDSYSSILGNSNTSTATNSIIIGNSCSIGSTYGIAIGNPVSIGSGQNYCVNIGTSNSFSSSGLSVAIGTGSIIGGGASNISIGNYNHARGSNGIAIGSYVTADTTSCCFGNLSTCQVAYNFNFGTSYGYEASYSLSTYSSIVNREIHRTYSAWIVSTDASRTSYVTHNVFNSSGMLQYMRADATSTVAIVGIGGNPVASTTLQVKAGAIGNKALCVSKFSSGQTANLFEIQDESNVALDSFDKDGYGFPIPVSFNLAVGIAATTGTDKTPYVIVPRAGKIVKAFIRAKTGPSGSDLIVDINLNGTSIWNSTPANRLKIVDGGTNNSTTSFDTTAVSEGDYFSIDVDQIGSGTAGQDISIVLLLLTKNQ